MKRESMRSALRTIGIVAGVTLLIMSVGCRSDSGDSAMRVEIHGSGPAEANRFDETKGQDEAYVVVGTVTDRGVFQIKDDPYRPDYSTFDLRGLSSEEREALARANDEAPVMRWNVAVSKRERGPQVSEVGDAIHLTRPLNDIEWEEYQRDGTLPARFSELKPGSQFEFSLFDDRFRRRGQNRDDFDFFVLVGWRAVADTE